MADGSVIRTGGKNIKDVAGYSLTHLFVGSQGTLAITTEATLRLRPAPPPRSTMLAFFPTLDGAGDAVAGIAAAGLIAGHPRAPRRVHDRRGRRHEQPRARPERGGDADDRVRHARRRRRRRARTGGGGLPRRGRDRRHPGRRRPGGRLAAPGPARRPLRPRAARRCPDGGRRRAAGAGPGHAPRDRADRGEARRPDRHVRARRRRQPPPRPRLRARRPERRGEDRGGQEGPLPGGPRPRWHGHRRARHRHGPARLARGPEGRRRRPGHALDQGGPRSARHPQSRAGRSRPRRSGPPRVIRRGGEPVSRP